MGLNLKTFSVILNSMASWAISHSSKLTNFFPGSVIRTLYESIAIEIEALYFQMNKGFQYAVQNSIYTSFGFFQTPAVPSSGDLTLVFSEALPVDITIMSGYQFCTSPSYGDTLTFSATQDTTFSQGSINGVITVKCTTPGISSNVPANTITIAVIPVSIIQSIYNIDAFNNGEDEETKDHLKSRFTTFIKTLAKGTPSAISYGALSVSGIVGVYINDGVGIVQVYAHDNAGNLSDSLSTAVSDNLLNYRSAGVEVEILPVTKVPVDIVITVMLITGYDSTTYSNLILAEVTSYLNNFTVSNSLILSDLIRFIMDIDRSAIYNATPSISSDVVVTMGELIRAGSIQVII